MEQLQLHMYSYVPMYNSRFWRDKNSLPLLSIFFALSFLSFATSSFFALLRHGWSLEMISLNHFWKYYILLFFAAYVICKKNYSFTRVVFLFFSVQNCQLFLFKNKTAGYHRLIFRPTKNILINFCKRLKTKLVLNLVFKEFLQTSIPPLISVLYAKGYHDFQLKNFCLTVPKNFAEEPFCVWENFWYRKMLGIREGAGITIFRQNCFVSQYRIIS